MSSPRRFVVDTNVIVSALLFYESTPGQAFASAAQRGKVLISDALVRELGEVLGRDKFRRYVTRDECEAFLEAFIYESELVATTTTIQACRDEKDNALLGLAVDGKADVVVTGDDDLLVLNPFQGIEIVTPARLLSILEDAGPAAEAER